MLAFSMVSKFLSTDVVCVKCWRDYVLAGVGGYLRVFNISSSEKVLEEKIFSSHNVRGIGVNIGDLGDLLIYGSREIAIVRISTEDTPKLTIIKRRVFDDWILTADFNEDPATIRAVTAHNVTYLWSWEDDRLSKYTCAEKCMLYCAIITPEPWKLCAVLGGTVFKEVVIWCPGSGDSEEKSVVHRLCGHKGVLFSINFDPYNEYISTTSDDRSVRLWKVKFPNSKSKFHWEKATITHLHVLYAHTARVWQSLLLAGSLVSVGEDSQLCVWNYSGKLIHKWKIHQGTCIWTVDYNKRSKVLITGGSDGAICTWPLDLHLPNAAALHSSPVLNGNPRRLVLLYSGAIVCVTDAGVLYKSDDKGQTWQEIYKDSHFANYCLLGVSPDRKVLSMASLRGKIVVLLENGNSWKPVINQQVVTGKIFACLWLSEEIILTCADQGLMPIFSFTRKGKKGYDLSRIHSLFLPPSKERFPTCAALLTQNKTTLIACGDRVGSLHLYTLGTSAKDTSGVPPVHSLNRIHGCLGTTSVTSSGGHRFISTGRDGCVRELQVDSSGEKMVVRTCTRLPMDWVDGLLSFGDRQQQLAICYKESDLIIWVIKDRRPLVQVWCAGGHRSLDCFIHEGDLLVSFVQNKMVWGGSWPVEMKLRPSLQAGFHPREVNCAYLTNSADFTSGHKWVFTGGEDGTIRLLSIQSQDEDVVVAEEAVLNGHISSVRAISMVNHPKIGRLLFSAGGRAQMKAWQFFDDSDVYCSEISSHMLMGSERRKCNTEPTLDPETRYMSLSCLLRLTDILIVAGCSDGFVRVLEFRSNPASFRVIAENDFHGKCVLSTSTFRLFDGRSLLLTSATDGQIALWDLSGFLLHGEGNASDGVNVLKFEPFWNFLVHQTGINAVDVTTVDRRVLIASGGDDSSVVLTVLEWELDYPCPSVALQKRNGLAHSAQVTGVRIVGNIVITSSTDQRVTLWKWSLKNGLSCDILTQYLSSVADLQDLQVWLDGTHLYELVVGRGLQVLEIT